MDEAMSRRWLFAVSTILVVCGCGGADRPSPRPASTSGTTIGPAGGTVVGPSGAQVVIPAGALSAPTLIDVTQSSTGAPALPAGLTAVGPMFAFTPHGTHFGVPATITVTFDPASVPAGTALALYKTDATQTAWELVPGAAVNGSAMVGQVNGFSHAVVALFSPTEKQWEILERLDGSPTTSLDGGTVGEPLEVAIAFGAQPGAVPPGVTRRVNNAEIHSNESGRTFWTEAVAPAREPGSLARWTRATSKLTQTFFFEATEDSPSLSFVITNLRLETIDSGGQAPDLELCPWMGPNPTDEQRASCVLNMSDANVTFKLTANGLGNGAFFYDIGGYVFVNGQHRDWTADILMTGASRMLWTHADLIFEPDADHDLSLRHFVVKLAAPKKVELPIAHLHAGDVFLVEVVIESDAHNAIQGESFVGAFLRDPVEAGEIDLTTTGLRQIPPRSDISRTPPAATCTTGTNPAAGVLEFSASEFSAPERSRNAGVLVQRSGGSSGPVSVLVQSQDGSAVAGSDYQAVSTVVRFEEGEMGPQLVQVPLLDDSLIEANETVTLSLSQVGGCAQLGARSTATLTILDDDQPLPPAPTFTVGGTVSGLVGTGLVLSDVFGSGRLTPTGNGAFTLPLAVRDASPYDVRVETQPSNPTQQCTVTHGAGQVAAANVTDIAVSCTTVAAPGGLDPSFGSGGRAVTSVAYSPNLLGARIGMALQSDGKILLVGGLKLLRLKVDGSPDASFGTAGVVNVVFDGGGLDTAMDVAVQADGKIVVAGTTSTFVVGSDNFALTRFNSDGSLDTTFGSGGHVTTDFFGSTDQVRRMHLQTDGKILVVGLAVHPISPSVGSTVFAIARYTADGTPDVTFAINGKTTDSPGNSFSVANGLAIQSDGKIVVAGSTAASGGDEPDTGFVRYLGDGQVKLPGTRDESFGPMSNGTLQAPLGGDDQAVDVVTLADGTILGAIRLAVAGRSGFGLAHIPASGVPAPKVPQPFITFTTDSDNPRSMLQQSDGKIVVVGQSANLGSNPDMAIARFNDGGFALDSSFGTDGKLTVDFFGGRDGAEAVVQQADGKLVVGGFARSGTGNVFAAVRVAQ